MVSLASVFGLVIAAAVAGYSYVNHAASSIPRIQVAHLTAAGGPAGGPTGPGQTFLLTGASFGPTGTSFPVPSPPSFSGLIMLLHIDPDGQTGGVVSIPPQAEVQIPGHGVQPLWNAARIGGPSLLVQTVEQLTGVPINHFARINFNQVSHIVDAIGGVTVDLPAATTSFGHTFQAGPNHLTGLTSIFYARQVSLSEEGRVLRQQSLIRAVIHKIANRHLLTNPASMVRLVNAAIRALAVDSTFTNSEIESLAKQVAGLGSSGAVFITAPSHMIGGQVFLDRAISNQLWTAIKTNTLAEFAKKFPETVTPEEVP
jgi:LCP family protein required for cell wall assembly